MNAIDQSPREVDGRMSRPFSSKSKTMFATWNVRTMAKDGIAEQVAKVMTEYSIGLLGISETRWTCQGQTKIEGFTFLHSGEEKRRFGGVGLMLNKHFAASLLDWKPVNQRIITARFQGSFNKISVIQLHV